jgi:competence protein ComEC
MVAGAWEGAADGVEETRVSGLWRKVFEAQTGRGFLWAPVALTFGIWIYFVLPVEPFWVVLGPLGMAAMMLLWRGRRRPILALLGLVIVGCVLAKAKADWVAAPALHATTAERLITGTVEDSSPVARGRQTIILAADQIEGFTTAQTPHRLRLTAMAKQGVAQIGSRIAVKAYLAPLPSPVIPGGFDYGRSLWLDGIGGTGRVTAPIDVLSTDVPSGLMFSASIEALRQAIGARIRQTLTGTTAAIGEAIITGERSSIPKPVNLSFQVSGLAHVLSISGLHMALAAGGVFWLVRALLAAFPTLALRHPIKKWAAAAALVAGLFYMILAGTGVATQRSYIMIAVVFFAIMVDRLAISVRNLAIAGLLILLMQPDAATEASFQMSFLAVMGLAAYYEFWTERRRGREKETRQPRHWIVEFARKIGGALIAAILTTIIAGTMSSIPAAYHFGRLAPYSVVANGLALPVVGFVIMPMALLSLLAMPLGLEHWPLWAMGKGIDLMMAISDWVAGFPGAYMVVPTESAQAAIVTALGAVLLCLVRGPARLGGIALALAGMALGSASSFPDVIVEGTGAIAAFRNSDGALVPVPGTKGGFALSKWLIANGEESIVAEARQRPGWTCSESRCVAKVNGFAVGFLHETEGKTPDCAGLDIVVTDFPLRGACRAVPTRIDRFDLWRNGAYAIRIIGGSATVTTARGEQGARPWTVVPEARTDKFPKR